MDKAINTLQICYKARKIIYGEKVFVAIRNHQVFLVVIANDIGKDNLKKLKDKTTTYNIPIIIYKDKNTFQNIFNKNVSYFGVNDENLAKKFIENIRGGEENGKECD